MGVYHKMITQWIVFFIVCFLIFSYYKQYSLKTRLITLAVVFLISLVLASPLLGFSLLTLLEIFIIEKVWLLLALILFIESARNKKYRILKIILAVLSLMLFFYLRTVI